MPPLIMESIMVHPQSRRWLALARAAMVPPVLAAVSALVLALWLLVLVSAALALLFLSLIRVLRQAVRVFSF
jgi:hypothetical protein